MAIELIFGYAANLYVYVCVCVCVYLMYRKVRRWGGQKEK
jgi:hypothetical protein